MRLACERSPKKLEAKSSTLATNRSVFRQRIISRADSESGCGVLLVCHNPQRLGSQSREIDREAAGTWHLAKLLAGNDVEKFSS
jgi:hypothetical protein